jgi:hypothetical protein
MLNWWYIQWPLDAKVLQQLVHLCKQRVATEEGRPWSGLGWSGKEKRQRDYAHVDRGRMWVRLVIVVLFIADRKAVGWCSTAELTATRGSTNMAKRRLCDRVWPAGEGSRTQHIDCTSSVEKCRCSYIRICWHSNLTLVLHGCETSSLI